MQQGLQRIIALLTLALVPASACFAASDDISRLYNFTARTTIQSAQMNAEFNQLISSMNGKAGRAVNNTMSGNNTFSGSNTFSGTASFSNATTGLLTDTIGEYTGSAGVTVGGVLLKSGYIRPSLSSDPTTAKGNLWFNSTTNLLKFYDGTTTQTVATLATAAPILQGHLGGYTLSNDGTTPDTDIDIAAGMAADSTAVDYIKLPSSLVKRVSTAWTVGTGNGCLDTGTIPTSGTVHIFAIKRTDTSVVDVLCSTSTTPTMPANYTEKRRIGSILTDSSAHIVPFTQTGDRFDLATPVLDVSVSNQGTTAVLRSLSVPSGLNVYAWLNVIFSNSAASQQALYIRNPDLPDNAPSTSAAPLATFITENNSATSDYAGGMVSVLTNVASQVTTRATANSLLLKIATLGWVDRRGRDE